MIGSSAQATSALDVVILFVIVAVVVFAGVAAFLRLRRELRR